MNHSPSELRGVNVLICERGVTQVNSIWKVSDAEVSAAIRYLDPDLQDGSKIAWRSKPHLRRRITVALVISSIAAILYIAATRYLPVLVRLLS